jgi:hypothetical protein
MADGIEREREREREREAMGPGGGGCSGSGAYTVACPCSMWLRLYLQIESLRAVLTRVDPTLDLDSCGLSGGASVEGMILTALITALRHGRLAGGGRLAWEVALGTWSVRLHSRKPQAAWSVGPTAHSHSTRPTCRLKGLGDVAPGPLLVRVPAQSSALAASWLLGGEAPLEPGLPVTELDLFQETPM